ncbi:DNA-directed RNA polymerase subunit beta' [Deinococcus metallilatus]|uniref:DNA-directed RNA polymerase subunit beta' n=1 Tax=Deinococcus metallilatus TaxID=1211322 RepID=A0AAJ5K5J2_9DEIO|nr:DNA-directed RNA polymerase subunit beta' [Deinococcus metallilatus]MBB5295028.1 DNA-directed RNA polymerase subunit beta' [Deinococcus metallilatus]QBY09281.1 DNA-directed RNA polymerase subunit beta' [Deinococcus metallilatus]RXJ09286.1 DNA-directed RNA polymerase subunit beta' [Deinococcus metallilatus]TLK28808.1 DNA-directed RNA polymerase subunit beta' [Deinococcus metallilatus]GMA16961.1 DNA-directed RNA polymerase subunit beta' [Deinococcus metallilatus]
MKDFNKVRIAIASPAKIREWSFGEVEKPETINYRTLKPEREGLFDERIFGPQKDYECACGKYKRQRYEGKVCERCGVEVTSSKVRRYRMGHIDLATPAAHIWYVKDTPSKIGTLLDLSAGQLEKVLYFSSFLVTQPLNAQKEGRPLKRGELLSDDEYRELRFGRQETYTLPNGTEAVIRDGEYVTRGQVLGGNVVSKMDGLAQYRFPRRAEIAYAEQVEASLPLPAEVLVEQDSFRAGEILAELEQDVQITAPVDGTAFLFEMGEDSVMVELRDSAAEDAAQGEVLARVYIPHGMNVQVAEGEVVEAGTVLATAEAGDRLRVSRDSRLTDVTFPKKKGDVKVTAHWTRRVEYAINPTMHVLVGDGSEVRKGQKVVGAIDKEEEVVAEADGVITLHAPASIIVSKAKVYSYQDEPLVVNGDRVEPGDELADSGNLRSEISGRVEIDLVRKQVRVIESYDFEAKMGAEAVKELLDDLDLDQLEAELGEQMKDNSRHKRAKARKRLEVVRSFKRSGNNPSWMILETVPVMPPDLRPMVQVDGGRFATSDLNDLYRRLINRNNRLKKLMSQGAPDMIIRNEKRMLQEAVDALIDNGRRGSPVTNPGSDRSLRSLTDLLGGKQGRFRQNLLGKRVDYSGRSVIVVGPQLKLHQCGVPKRMALELFKPFLFKVLEEKGEVTNIKQARKMLERYRDTRDSVWDALEEVIEDKVVLLNRAPTLHRLGIQAFEPVLVEGQSIQLHPLVCEAFNADFDGDQMAIHVPLSAQAQAEARIQMLSAHNLLSPANGEPNVKPSRDIILGIFTLTQLRKDNLGAGSEFANEQDALNALNEGRVALNTPITVNGVETSPGRLKYVFSSPDEAIMAVDRGEIDYQDHVRIRLNGTVYDTSAGRVMFRRLVQEALGAQGHLVDTLVNLDTAYEKDHLKDMVMACYKELGIEATAGLLDALKDNGFKLSTTSGITIGIDDIVLPPNKGELLAEADEKLAAIEQNYEFGFMTDEERYKQVVQLWNDTTDEVKNAVFENFSRNYPFNPLWIMSQSGARGNPQQIRQLAGMRGLMARPDGSTIEVPIKASFREGLTVLEYFISTHGARKGGADTALRTADSGYLTRKLVDVAHEVVVRDVDCGTTDYTIMPLGATDERTGEWRTRKGSEIETSIYGRTLTADVELQGGRVIPAGEMLSLEDVKAITKDAKNIGEVFVRTPLNCRVRAGVCQKCYGYDLSQAKPVSMGEAVGVVAAESIGEPGTQLTMRTFHTGGVAGGGDITMGLPRVIELFEARKPKTQAVVADRDGVVRIEEEEERYLVRIEAEDEAFSSKTATKISKGLRLIVRDGDHVEAGQPLTRGAINPHDLLLYKDTDAAQRYLVEEVQRVYRSQGVKVHDKHIEVIVRQMLRYVEITDGGDTDLLEGQTVERWEVDQANEALAEGQTPASWKPVLLGITKSSLTTKSWLSAASFQHTTHVLTEASMRGQVDDLIGLKENVILGKLIPAGTGLTTVREMQVADDRTLEKYGEGNVSPDSVTGTQRYDDTRPVSTPINPSYGD